MSGFRAPYVALFLLVFSVSNHEFFAQGDPGHRAEKTGWDQFGEGVTIDARTPIETILARPEDFVGNPVAVEGTVVGVCGMMGCWMELEGGAGKSLRIQVEDGVIIFPPSAVGRHAIAQGSVERLAFSREEYEAFARHEAEEMGREFDPQTLEGPFEEILLRGTGALIQKAASEGP